MSTDRDTMSHCTSDPAVVELSPVTQPVVETDISLKERIINLLRLNMTSNQVARELNISRHVVVGVKARYNKKNPNDIVGITKATFGFRSGPKVKIKKDKIWRGKPRITLPEVFATTGHVPDRAKHIWELKDGECKYSVTPHGVPPDKHMFCGPKTLDNSPYCIDHHRICRETVNDRKGKNKDNPARGAVRLPSRFRFHY